MPETATPTDPQIIFTPSGRRGRVPVGTTVLLDGSPVPASAFVPIGGSGFAVARVSLAGGSGDGNHRAESSTPFGISVYGYGQYTSYWYPGGLDLAEIPIP